MEIGIDSFAAADMSQGNHNAHQVSMQQLIERIICADQLGLDLFGIGEHHRAEFLDSAPTLILAAAAQATQRIRLTSAVSVLSVADPVRLFQQFATLDLISKGRAEMIVGRGSFTEAFPLFGYQLHDYEALFSEKLDLLLRIQDEEKITWKGEFRPMLNNQSIYPRPIQSRLPIWIGTGGTSSSFERAGRLGLPLMIAIIGGKTHRFRPLIEQYKAAWRLAGHPEDQMKIGIHSLGYVAKDAQQARDDFYPGYKKVFTKIGQERGWRPITRDHFEAQTNEEGALVVGSPEEVAQKINRHSEALGGIDRFSFQMNVAALSHDQLMTSISYIAQHVMPIIKKSHQ